MKVIFCCGVDIWKIVQTVEENISSFLFALTPYFFPPPYFYLSKKMWKEKMAVYTFLCKKKKKKVELVDEWILSGGEGKKPGRVFAWHLHSDHDGWFHIRTYCGCCHELAPMGLQTCFLCCSLWAWWLVPSVCSLWPCVRGWGWGCDRCTQGRECAVFSRNCEPEPGLSWAGGC